MADEPRIVLPANPHPCTDCPWRLSNQGKRHAHGFYSKRNLQRLWSGLRRGARMSCHPTDPRMAEFSGYEATEHSAHTHECTGSLVLIQREWMKLESLHKVHPTEQNISLLYRRAHPHGLTRIGILELAGRAMFTLPGELEMTRPDLDQPDVGYERLGKWEDAHA